MPPTGGRIELAVLKARERKLEAIAAGIDLRRVTPPRRHFKATRCQWA